MNFACIKDLIISLCDFCHYKNILFANFNENAIKFRVHDFIMKLINGFSWTENDKQIKIWFGKFFKTLCCHGNYILTKNLQFYNLSDDFSQHLV